MNTNDNNQFPFVTLFAVTSVSFFLFSLAIRVLDGAAAHSALFFWFGLACAGLCLVSAVWGLLGLSGDDREMG